MPARSRRRPPWAAPGRATHACAARL